MNRDEQVLKNLGLAESFLHDVIDAPTILDGIPDGTTIVLIPEDDMELAGANMEAARQLIPRCPKNGSEIRSGTSKPEREHAGGVYLRHACS